MTAHNRRCVSWLHDCSAETWGGIGAFDGDTTTTQVVPGAGHFLLHSLAAGDTAVTAAGK